MAKITKAALKEQAINQIIAEFEKSGTEFTCLASFHAVRDYARFLAHKIAENHGVVFSTSMYFPQVASGDNLMYWASNRYCENFVKGLV